MPTYTNHPDRLMDVTAGQRVRKAQLSQWESMPELEMDLEYMKNLDPKNPTETKVEQTQRLMLAAMAMAAANNEPYVAPPMQLDPVDPQGYADAHDIMQNPFYQAKLAPPVIPGPRPKGPRGLPANPAMKPKMGY